MERVLESTDASAVYDLCNDAAPRRLLPLSGTREGVGMRSRAEKSFSFQLTFRNAFPPQKWKPSLGSPLWRIPKVTIISDSGQSTEGRLNISPIFLGAGQRRMAAELSASSSRPLGPANSALTRPGSCISAGRGREQPNGGAKISSFSLVGFARFVLSANVRLGLRGLVRPQRRLRRGRGGGLEQPGQDGDRRKEAPAQVRNPNFFPRNLFLHGFPLPNLPQD